MSKFSRKGYPAEAKAVIDEPADIYDFVRADPKGFTAIELAKIYEAASRSNLYEVQSLMQAKQSVDRETLQLHGRVFDLRNDAHKSVLADLYRECCSDVLVWAERKMQGVAA